MIFELIDLEELGDQALADFTQTVGQVQPVVAETLTDAVNRLVTKVEFTYAVAAKLAQREPTVEGTAAIWAKMVTICDQIAAQVKGLDPVQSVPQASFDRILDLRNAAERRRELHS